MPKTFILTVEPLDDIDPEALDWSEDEDEDRDEDGDDLDPDLLAACLEGIAHVIRSGR